MKKIFAIIILICCTLAVSAQSELFVSRLYTVQPANSSNPETNYNGGVSIKKQSASAQYINLIRAYDVQWSIGTVYNSNTFAIGKSTYLETDFTSPLFTIKPTGEVGIGISTPTSKLHISNLTSLSGIGGANINVTQTRPNTSDLSDNALSVVYGLTAVSTTNEQVNVAANIISNNYLTGGGAVQSQRVLNLSSGTSNGSKTTNLEIIRIAHGTPSGVTTNAYGINIVSLPGINRWGIYDQSGSKWYTNGKVGIGDVAPGAKLSVIGNAAIGYASGQTAPANGMIISGSVGIGTPTPNPIYALDVNGIICANEVKVTLTHFPDFVFDSDYKLPKLNDVHSYIKANGHLPNIPSAIEVKKDGIGLADMQVKLLQKVEELTLYAIEQQKQIESLKSELSQMKKQ